MDAGALLLPRFVYPVATCIGLLRWLGELGLDIPRSTTALAQTLSLSPGAVSQHLAVVVSAGLCSSRRDGKRVLYSRTPRAEVLLDIDAAQARRRRSAAHSDPRP